VAGLLRLGFGLFHGGVVAADAVPVDDLHESGDVFGAAVLVFEVVGVLPDVDAEDGGVAEREGAVLVRRGLDGEGSGGVAGEPGPAAAEDAGTGFGEGGLEGGERAESGVDVFGEFGFRSGAAGFREDGPQKVWFASPPPWLRTAVRTDSGREFRLLRSCSGVLMASSGWLATAMLRLLT